MISARLIELLVCPQDKQPLEYIEAEKVLYNTRLRCAYEVRDDIPVMLSSDARRVEDTEHAHLTRLIDTGGSKRTGK